MTEIGESLLSSEQARKQFKIDIEELSGKMIENEEELFESKSLQLELLDTI